MLILIGLNFFMAWEQYIHILILHCCATSSCRRYMQTNLNTKFMIYFFTNSYFSFINSRPFIRYFDFPFFAAASGFFGESCSSLVITSYRLMDSVMMAMLTT